MQRPGLNGYRLGALALAVDAAIVGEPQGSRVNGEAPPVLRGYRVDHRAERIHHRRQLSMNAGLATIGILSDSHHFGTRVKPGIGDLRRPPLGSHEANINSDALRAVRVDRADSDDSRGSRGADLADSIVNAQRVGLRHDRVGFAGVGGSVGGGVLQGHGCSRVWRGSVPGGNRSRPTNYATVA